MKRLSVAFCDDDAIVRGHMRTAAERCFSQYGVAVHTSEFDGPGALLDAMGRERFGLLFLDIDMPEMDGIELGERLRALGSGTDIIYVSNLDERVYEVFRVHPWSFVRKSRFDEQIDAVVADYVQMMDSRASRIVVQDAQGASRAVAPEEVVYVESAGKLQKLFFPEHAEPMQVRCSLMELEGQLAAAGFIRIHKGFLVNYRFVRRIRSRSVELDDGRALPVGRDRLESVRERYLALMKCRTLAPRNGTGNGRS